MKRLILLIFSACFMLMNSNSQTIELTFTAVDSTQWVQLDSIKVMNRTQGGDTVLHYPDTVLILYHVGIQENNFEHSVFQVHQNYPNPVMERTNINVCVPEKDKVKILITDALGRKMLSSERVLDKGCHKFSFKPGNAKTYFLTALYKGESQSIKILNVTVGNSQQCSIEYQGSSSNNEQLKTTPAVQNFSFTSGDELLYIGYADTLQSGILDTPETSEVYTFQFATNIPCPGTPTVEYEGQTYNTVQIMSQCWLKENLNVGTMIAGWDDMTDNDFIEKYCYDNELDSCAKYGGLYQWDEMMQYTSQQGTQGICPPGWHLPNETEWNVLEGATDSQYNIGDLIWDEAGYRGYDVGFNLKSISGWSDGGNGSDLFGFLALPGGHRGDNAVFDHIDGFAHWWVSMERDNGLASSHHMRYYNLNASQWDNVKTVGFSVRCLRDVEPTTDFTELTFTAINNLAYLQLDSIKIMNRTHEGEIVLHYPDTNIILEFELPNYQYGDKLLLIGYYDTLQSGMLDAPEESQDYTFQFAYNFPCPGTPTVEYEGQTYNTVQIMSQCWLKENLNVGTRIDAPQLPSDNDTIEKYCMGNMEWVCDETGGLYFWNEMMNYTNQTGGQGICPDGWHVPKDLEWMILEGAADSGFPIGDMEWIHSGWRGYDAGGHLKQTGNEYWEPPNTGATDIYGFTALPGGYFVQGDFWGLGYKGIIWSSESQGKYFRQMERKEQLIKREGGGYPLAISVRCIKD